MQNKRRGRIPQSAWPDILKRHNDGETLSSIARDFDCTPSAISYVLKKATNGEGADLDGDDLHETPDAPLLEHSEPERSATIAAEPASQTEAAPPAVAPDPSSSKRDEWRDERRPTMRLPGNDRQSGERSDLGQRQPTQREQFPRDPQFREQNLRDQPAREQSPREQWQPRETNRDIVSRDTMNRDTPNRDGREQGNDTRPPRNFDNRGERQRRDDAPPRDDMRRDDPRQRAPLNQNAAPETRSQPQPQAAPTNVGTAPQPVTSEYRPSPPFRAVVAEETIDAPVVEVDTRIDTGATELRAAYAAWRKAPSPEALDALQTAVHETRKVLARIEIDIAAARGNDAAPRANFRHTYRAAHR